MARYSSDSDDDRRRKKKKYRSRSRSQSSLDSYSSSRSSRKKSKKSKKKQRRRSRSRSSEYRRRRSRSNSRSRRRSRSYSRSRRSRSRSKRRRSRSRDRRSRSGSRYRSRRRRSRSYKRSYSRSPKPSRSRRDSYSKSPARKRSHSRSRSASRPKTSEGFKPKDAQLTKHAEDPCAVIPGFQDMTPSEQNEIRMKMALKAAAETTARLREQGVLSGSSGVAAADVERRHKAIADIEEDGFVQQNYTSSRANPKIKEESADNQHEAAMFGDVTSLATIPKAIVYKDTDSILAPIFYEDSDAKWDRWVEYVREYRRKKLEGEAMT